MKQTVNYSDLPVGNKQQSALDDIRRFLGLDHFNQLTADFRAYRPLEINQFSMFAGIAGIEGYPVEVWYKYIYNPLQLMELVE